MLKKALEKDADIVVCDMALVYEDGAIVNCPNLLKVWYTPNISFDVDSIDEPDDIDLSILEGVFLV